MKFSSITFLCILTVTPVVSFTNPSLNTRQTTSLQAERNHNKNSKINNVLSNCYAIAAMSALLWGSPTMLAEQASTHQYQFPFGLNDVIEHNVMANAGGGAQDKASATGSRVNKDPESLLRLGLPINNKQVRSACALCFNLSFFSFKICLLCNKNEPYYQFFIVGTGVTR